MSDDENNAVESVRVSVQSSLQRMEDRINAIATPNFGTIWAAVGVVASVILAIGAIVAAGFQREMNRQDLESEKVDARHIREEDKLDERLQREYHQVVATVNEKIDAVKTGDENRHLERVRLFEQQDRRITLQEGWATDRIKADLEELRQRRMEEKR